MNISNYKKVLQQIKEHPETWEQNKIGWGPKRCFLGWARYLCSEEFAGHLFLTTEVFLGLNENEILWLHQAKRTLADFERFLEEKEKNDK